MFAYSYGIKIHALEFNQLLESFFCLLVVVEAFSLQKVVEMFEELVSQLSRGQVSMVDVAKLHSPIRSTFEALSVRCAVRHCQEEELDPFC